MPNPDAESKKEEGNRAFASKDYDKAVSLYTDAIKIDPTNHVYFSNRSASHFGAGRHSDAASDARECLRLDPTFLKGYYRLAAAQIESGDLNGAASTARSGLRVDPDNSNLQRQLRTVKARQAAKAQAERAAAASSAAASAGGRGLVDASARKELADLREQFESTRREYQKVQLELAQRQHEQKRNGLTKSELEEVPVPEGGGDGPKMYRSVGKMFLLTKREDVFRHLDEAVADDEKRAEELGGKAEFLERRMKSQQQNIQELIRSN